MNFERISEPFDFFWRNIFKHFIFWHFIGFGTGDVNTEKTFENFGTFFLQCDISIIFCEFYIFNFDILALFCEKKRGHFQKMGEVEKRK